MAEQDTIDPIQTLNETAWQLRWSASNRAFDIAQQAQALAEQTGHERGVMRAKLTLASIATTHGNYEEARRAVTGIFDRICALGDTEGEAMAHSILSALYRSTGLPDEALKHSNACMNLSRQIGNKALEGLALVSIGNIHRIHGHYDQAMECYQQSLELAVAAGSAEGEGYALMSIASTYERTGRYETALEIYNRCAEIARNIPHALLQAYVTGNQAVIHRSLGDISTALSKELDCLRCKEELSDRRGISISLNNIGMFYYDFGAYDSALEALLQSLEICEQIGDREGESVALNNIGLLYDSLDNSLQALDCYVRSLRISQEIGYASGEAFSYYHIGKFHFDRRDRSKAMLYYLKCLRMHRESGDRHAERAALLAVGTVYRTLGDAAQGRDFIEQSRIIAVDIGDVAGEATALIHLGSMLREQGDYAAAIQYLERGLHSATVTGLIDLRREAIKELGATFRHTGNEQRRRECDAEYTRFTEQLFNENTARRLRDMTERFHGSTIRHEGELLGLEEEDLNRVQTAVRMEHGVAAEGKGFTASAAAADPAAGAADKSQVDDEKKDEGIRVHTLGAFRVIVDGRELRKPDWSRRRARELFKLLLLNHRSAVTISEIHDKLWGERADRNIEMLVMNAASHIRRALESEHKEAGSHFTLDCSDGAYTLDLGERAWIDFIRFRELVVAARRSSSVEERSRLYAEATELYDGDFLQEDLYADWTDFQRRLLKDAFLEGLEYLSREDLRMGRLEQAIAGARRILQHDDTSETAYRILLQGLTQCGRHGEARRVLEQCRIAFARELGKEPPEPLLELMR